MKRQVTLGGIIIESVENLKDENRGKMNYLSMMSKDKVLIKHLKGPLFLDLQRISKIKLPL
jgi:hypothetical protein